MPNHSLADLIGRDFENLEGFLATFSDGINGVQGDVFKALMKILDSLPQRDGNLIASEDIRKIILRFKDKIISQIGKGQFNDEYKSLLKKFDDLEPIRKELAGVFNPNDKAKILKANTSVIKQGFINTISNSLGSVASFEVNVVNPLTNILYEHAVIGATVGNTARKIFDIALSETIGGGILGRYAGQVAHDALYGYTGSVDKAIGDYIGASDVNYMGDLVRDSRPQCVRWVAKYGGFIPKEKLKSEIAWANKNGEGYSKHLPKLTLETFALVRGGRHCRHRVLYTNGKNPKTKEAENAYNKLASDFEKKEEAKLTGIAKKRFEENKAIVQEKIRRFAK